MEISFKDVSLNLLASLKSKVLLNGANALIASIAGVIRQLQEAEAAAANAHHC